MNGNRVVLLGAPQRGALAQLQQEGVLHLRILSFAGNSEVSAARHSWIDLTRADVQDLLERQADWQRLRASKPWGRSFAILW